MDAFVIGSGFSKAIHDSMPIVRDLKSELNDFAMRERPHQGLNEISPFEDLEAFLGYLAVPQPFLSDAENEENHALFMRVSEWLARRIFDAQNHATGSSAPEWLERLVRKWDASRTCVLTLNYDCLIEAVLRTFSIPNAAQQVLPFHIYPFPLPFDVSRTGGLVLGPEERDTFTLFKLHGSVNWFYSGLRGSYGDPIFQVTEIPPFDRPSPPSFESFSDRNPGLVPLVVPPTPGKSDYFDNGMLREIWLRAERALRKADVLYAIGYSFPPGDLQIQGLMARTTDDGQRVVIVNTDEEAAERCQEILPMTGLVEHSGGPNCISDFVDAYC